jgi:hypothetical protein
MLRAATPPLVMPAFVPGRDEISCKYHRLHQRACRSPSLAFLAVVRPNALAADETRRWCVRVHARVRAGTSPSHRRAPQHVCILTRETRLNLGPFLALGLEVALLSAAPPWLRHGWTFHARRRREGSAALLTGENRLTTGHRFLTHALAPDRGRLVRRRPWRRAGLRSELRRAAPLRPAPDLSPCRAPYARAHPSARPCARVNTPPPREGTRKLLSAAAAPASPRGDDLAATAITLCCASLRAQRPKGSPVRLSCKARSPRRRGTSPPAKS